MTRVDAVVTGGGGFIGGHLVADLLAQGKTVRAVDIKPTSEWWQVHDGAENVIADLKDLAACRAAVEGGASEVYNLAADMGGIGFIEGHKADCMLSVLISTHMLVAANESNVDRFFYSSSACIYPAYRQDNPDVTALKEDDAYPAAAEDGYGWEKLFSERLARHFREDFGLQTRMARFHNIYGPNGSWDGGREKSPAAICRKVAVAELTGQHDIEIWGDGTQTRSYCYIGDAVEGIQMITRGDYVDPLNLGSNQLVTVNELVSTAEAIAGIDLKRKYVTGALGVAGRNSDNTLIDSVFGWEPSTKLAEGLEPTYRWIRDQVAAKLGITR